MVRRTKGLSEAYRGEELSLQLSGPELYAFTKAQYLAIKDGIAGTWLRPAQ